MNPLRKIGLKSWIYLIPDFGLVLPLKLALAAYMKLILPSRYLNIAFEYKHKVINAYLKKRIGNLAKQVTIDSITRKNKKVIWVFWWQGVEDMPPIVKRCYNQLLRINCKYKVQLISKDNYSKYVSIPHYITSKIGDSITITHFSDILRVNLLYAWGGIWVDATLFFIKTIPKKYFVLDFFSIKDHRTSSMSVARHRWTSFFLCSLPGSSFMGKLCNYFKIYYANNSKVIDYLLIDYFIEITYNFDIKFKQIVDNMPYTDYDVHCMNKLKEKYAPSFLDNLIKENLFVKLSYKDIDESELLNANTNYRMLIKHYE